MEIILLENIQNLGKSGELVKVKNGYARNFLIPKRKAILATPETRAEAIERQHLLAEETTRRLMDARTRADRAVKEVAVARLCAEGGRLYGSVTAADIAEVMTASGVIIDKSEVSLPDGHIKNIGEFAVEINLHSDVKFMISVIVSEEGTNESDPVIQNNTAGGVEEPAESGDV